VFSFKAQYAMYRGPDRCKIFARTGILLALYLIEPFPDSATTTLFPSIAEYGELDSFDDTAVATRHHDAFEHNDEATRLSDIDAITATPRHPSLGEFSTAAYRQVTRLLFGMETEPEIGAFSSKWRAIQTEIEQEKPALTLCRAEDVCPTAARDLLDIIAQGADRTGRARVGLINRAVNLSLIPTSDERQWGVADHWSSPFETLQTHRGDCEDYAIVKYVALLEAGLSRDDLKIVILRKFLPDETHAVLAARVDGEWLILDNDKPALVRDSDLVRAQPEVLLDHDGAHRLISSD
jgi:predicted transglutaminase-like cysteine proteinase